MVEVMTDKATVTITSPRAGRVVETRGAVGEVVAVHAVLVVFELDATDDAPAKTAAAPGAGNGQGQTNGGRQEPAATAVGDIKETLPGLGAAPARAQPGARAGGLEEARYFNDKPLATPATRKLARDMNVDLRTVPPTGPDSMVRTGCALAKSSVMVPPLDCMIMAMPVNLCPVR